jgi:hypothetical protein
MKKVFVYVTLYFEIFAYYFIMHDIKYFFPNKNNQTIQRGQKKFPKGEGQITENIIEKHYFSKFRGQDPLGSARLYKHTKNIIHAYRSTP